MKLRPLKHCDGHQDQAPMFCQGADGEAWAIHPTSALAVYRFGQFLSKLPAHLPRLRPATGFMLCAVAYDCVMTVDDLVSMSHAANTERFPPAYGRVVWKSSREGYVHKDARCLSARSRLLLSRLPNEVDWTVELKQVNDFLHEHYTGLDQVAPGKALTQVLADARSWWYLHVPLCLYSHLQGAVRMPLLDERVFERLCQSSVEQTDDQTLVDSNLDEAHDRALDVVLDSSPNESPIYPRQSLELIQSIFAVSTNQAGLRLATHLNSEKLRQKLSMAMVGSEGWVAAVLMSWAVHLLTVGSVRKANPAVSTLAAYISALLEPLAKALSEKKYPPAHFSQQDWEELFDTLKTQSASGQQAAALASLHQWAVRTYGCDPLPDVIFQTVESTRVHANLIWPHEQQRALDMAAEVSLDERVSHQVQVMLALGSMGLFRIGEVVALTTSDLKHTDGTLKVRVDPGRGVHGGKSKAARRIVILSDPAVVELILRWMARRNVEAEIEQIDEVLLFGAPQGGNRLYKVGHCIRLANSILKQSTGDEGVSFHTLRHTGATYRAYPLLTQEQLPKAVAPLDELCFQMGHATRHTLWSTYFHLPEFALREAVDRIPSVAEFTAEEAAFWLDLTPAAVRQRGCRSVQEATSPQQLYGQWVRDKAECQDALLHRPGQPVAMNRPAAVPDHHEGHHDLRWVRQALAVIAQGCTCQAACLRLSCKPGDLLALSLTIQEALMPLLSQSRGDLPAWLLPSADADHALRWAKAQLDEQPWSFKLGGKAKLHGLDDFLERNTNEQVCSQAGEAWVRMYRKSVLSLHDLDASLMMLRMLRQAGLPVDALVMRVQRADPSLPADGLTIETVRHQLRAMAFEGFGAPLRIEPVQPLRGHPERYLLVSRTRLRPGTRAPSAGVRMNEFHGLLFALRVFQLFQAKKEVA